jgi:hypothetical protein
MEHDLHLDPFIQGFFQVKQATSERELVQTRVNLAAVVEPE